MPIQGEREPFQPSSLNKAPEGPGVFQLLSRGKTIYFGAAAQGLRTKLREHYSGKHGSCTQIATGFRCEECDDPSERREKLLKEYEKKYGEVPRCNL